MNVVELAIAAILAILGVRSLIHWLRRPVRSDARRDHALFALFVVSRVGLWFALSGLFVLFATIGTQGRAFIDDAGELRWYFFVLALPAAAQFVSGFLLGRPASRPDEDPDG